VEGAPDGGKDLLAMTGGHPAKVADLMEAVWQELYTGTSLPH
jgi:hypothetical protein